MSKKQKKRKTSTAANQKQEKPAITRRSLLYLGTALAAFAIPVAYYTLKRDNMAQPDGRNEAADDFFFYEVESNYLLSEYDKKVLVTDVIYREDFPYKNITSIRLKRPKRELYIKPETDKAEAGRFISQARDSIDSFMDYINSPYLKRPEPEFVVPQKKDDTIRPDSGSGLFMVVNDYYGKISVGIELGIPGLTDNELTSSYKMSSLGETLVDYKIDLENKTIKAIDKPILLKTNIDKIFQVEAPAVEYLHRSINRYTNNILEALLEETGYDRAHINECVALARKAEETVVHALSIPWLKGYLPKNHPDISDSSIDERISYYESSSANYKLMENVPAALKLLEEIGPSRFVEQYATEPRKLLSIKGSWQ